MFLPETVAPDPVFRDCGEGVDADWENVDCANVEYLEANMIIETQNIKRLGVFFFYDKDGKADRYVEYLIKEYAACQQKLIVVSNGTVSDDTEKMFHKYADDVIIRENRGLDFAAYLAAFHLVGWDDLQNYDEVSIMNSTLMGPVYPLLDMYREMEKKDVDFWGISKHFKFDYDATGMIPYGYIPEHIQSHYMVFRKSLVKSEKFQKFWDEMPEIKSYEESVALFEASFTKKFEDFGFKWDTYSDFEKYRGVSFNPIMEYPTELIEKGKCPFFKRRLFFQDELVVLNTSFGNPTSDLYRYIQMKTQYNVDYIWENIIRTCNHADFAKMLNLTYILPTVYGNDLKMNDKSLLIMRLVNMNMLAESLQYMENNVERFDVLVISSNENKELILEKCRQKGILNVAFYLQENEKNADLFSYVERYKYCCVYHDVQGEVQDYYAFKKNADSILYNAEYIDNIISLFETNDRLGILIPLEADHGKYFPILGREWGEEFEDVKTLLEKLEISIPIDSNKEPLAPQGGMFWFRVDALKSIGGYLDKGLLSGKERDNEILMLKALPFFALNAGFYPAYVSTEYGAQIEITTLRYYMHEYGNFLEKNGISDGVQWQMLRQLDNKIAGHIVNIDSPKYSKLIQTCQRVMPRQVFQLAVKIKRKMFK